MDSFLMISGACIKFFDFPSKSTGRLIEMFIVVFFSYDNFLRTNLLLVVTFISATLKGPDKSLFS